MQRSMSKSNRLWLQALLGAAFLEVIPHAFEQGEPHQAAGAILGGILGFFLLEKLLLWRHSHEHGADEEPLHHHEHSRAGLLIVVGDNRCAEELLPLLQSFCELTGAAPSGAVAYLPAMDVLPFENLSPHPEIQEERGRALWRISQGTASLVVAPFAATAIRLREAAYYRGLARTLRQGEEVVVGPPRPAALDLDALPLPAYDLFPLERYYGAYTRFRRRSLSLGTARGCPYRCIFCQNPGGTRYRKRALDAVMEEIEIDVSRHGAKLIYVTDETFTLDPGRTVAFCEGMLKRGFERRVSWFAETRVDAVTPELIRLLKRAGCCALFYGVESGNQETLDLSKKRIAKEEAIAAVRWAREAGIFTHTNYIFGNPFETEETILKTVRFAFEVDSDAAGFSIMVPYPGTEILRMARAGYGGLRLLSEDFRSYGKVVGGALELEGLPRHKMEALQLHAYARFYLRPRKLANLPRVGHLSAIPIVLAYSALGRIRRFVTGLAPAGAAT